MRRATFMTQSCVRIKHMTIFKSEGSQCGWKAGDGSRDAMSMVGCGGKQAGLIPTPNMALGKTFSRSVVRRSTYLLLRHAFALLAKASQWSILSSGNPCVIHRPQEFLYALKLSRNFRQTQHLPAGMSSDLDTLIDMGFERSKAELAVKKSGGRK